MDNEIKLIVLEYSLDQLKKMYQDLYDANTELLYKQMEQEKRIIILEEG